MMDDFFTSTATQIPIVAIFIWFILAWTKIQNEAMDKRDAAFLDALKEERQNRLNAMKEERAHRVEIITNEQEHRASLAKRLAEAIREVDTNVHRSLVKLDAIIRILDVHDARAEQYIAGNSAKNQDDS